MSGLTVQEYTAPIFASTISRFVSGVGPFSKHLSFTGRIVMVNVVL